MIIYTVMNSDGQLTYSDVKGWSNERIAQTGALYDKYWKRINSRK